MNPRYRLDSSVPDSGKARVIADRAEAIIKLHREMPPVPDKYVLEPYPKDNSDHAWIFRRNIIRHSLNRYEECSRVNQAWYDAGIISEEDWASTHEMHNGWLEQALGLIRRLPPNERRELASLLPQEHTSQSACAPPTE